MGVYYETIPDSLRPWIMEQEMLWVATCPLSASGHINISPKGGSNFGILSPTSFWYMDLTGSGVETHAHLHEPGNGRIVVMFIAFKGPPKIVRLWGKGRAIENGTGEFDAFVEEHKVFLKPGSRSIITIDIDQCATSCGFSVPYYDFVSHRPILDDFFVKKAAKHAAGDEKESMDRYWAFKSQLSIDGMPGMKRGYDFARENDVKPLRKFVGAAGARAALNAAESQREKITVLHLLIALFLGVIIGGALSLSVVTPERLAALRTQHIAF